MPQVLLLCGFHAPCVKPLTIDDCLAWRPKTCTKYDASVAPHRSLTPSGQMLAHLANLPHSRRQLCTICQIGGFAARGFRNRKAGVMASQISSSPPFQIRRLILKFRSAEAPHCRAAHTSFQIQHPTSYILHGVAPAPIFEARVIQGMIMMRQVRIARAIRTQRMTIPLPSAGAPVPCRCE